MKKRALILTTLIALFVQPSVSFAKFYIYRELITADHDLFVNAINKAISKAEADAIKMQEQGMDEAGDSQAVSHLRDALQLLLSRPDQDDSLMMRNDTYVRLRSELKKYLSYEDTIRHLATDAIIALKNDKFKPARRVTHLYILYNIMGQIKREAIEGNESLQKVILKIREANIKFDDKVQGELRMTSMLNLKSPSKIAADIADKFTKEKKGSKG